VPGATQLKNTDYMRPDVQKAEAALAKAREKAVESKAQQSMGALAMGQFENFIKILMATLKNQDPNNPMDVTQMASQFAQFGQVAGLLEIKNLLESSKDTQNVTQLLETARHTGREVEISTNQFHLEEKEPARLNFYNPTQAERASILITDGMNNPVRVLEMNLKDTSNPLKTGKNSIEWDGALDTGKKASIGNYKFRVTLFGKDNEMIRNSYNSSPLEVKTTVTGRISGGAIDHQQTLVVMGGENGIKLPVESIVSLQSKGSHNPLRKGDLTETSDSVSEEVSLRTIVDEGLIGQLESSSGGHSSINITDEL